MTDCNTVSRGGGVQVTVHSLLNDSTLAGSPRPWEEPDTASGRMLCSAGCLQALEVVHTLLDGRGQAGQPRLLLLLEFVFGQ